jgi:N-acetylglucosamine kinase-like BadF-type ATPase
MPLYLAVDAGGTTTDCLLADDTKVLTRRAGGTLKLIRAGEPQARANLDALLTQIAAQSTANLRNVHCTCIGLAGIAMPQYVAWIRERFAEHVGGELLIVGDEDIALDAAFRGGRGVLVLAGTGSNVVARAADGSMERAGGWGPALADEGSGHRIGSQALRAAFRAYDARERTALIGRILAHWQLAQIEDVVAEANRVPPPDFAALTPVVLACAEEGDAVAMRVLVSAGQELADTALIALRKLRELEPESPPPTVALSGSILRRVAPVREAMIEYLRSQIPALEILRDPVDPLDGALWRARSAC